MKFELGYENAVLRAYFWKHSVFKCSAKVLAKIFSRILAVEAEETTHCHIGDGSEILEIRNVQTQWLNLKNKKKIKQIICQHFPPRRTHIHSPQNNQRKANSQYCLPKFKYIDLALCLCTPDDTEGQHNLSKTTWENELSTGWISLKGVMNYLSMWKNTLNYSCIISIFPLKTQILREERRGKDVHQTQRSTKLEGTASTGQTRTENICS